MSTMDYLEFKNYLEHGFFNKKKKQYYKTEATTAPKLPVGSIAIPRDKVEEYIKSGKMSTDAIYRGAYSNRASGKAVYQKKSYGWPICSIPESDEDFKKRTEKYAIDVGQARHNMVKSYNSQLNAKKDLERAEKRIPFIKKVKDSSSALVEAYSVWNNAKKDLTKAGGNVSAATVLKKKVEDARKDIISKSDDLQLALSYIQLNGDVGIFTDDEVKAATKLRNEYNKSTQTIGEYAAKKASELFHDNLEHASIAGVPSRLRSKMQSAIYKKTGYQSKGSYAGAPANAKQATADQNKAVANARFSANIKSAIEACNRDAAEAQSVYVEATTRINNIVSRSRGEVNSIIRSVNDYNENVRNVRKQTITKKSTFATVANGKMYQGVRDEQVPVDPNRQFISFSAGAQKISANKYVYKPKMLLIDSDPGTYKEV